MKQALAMALACALSAPVVAADWPIFRGDAALSGRAAGSLPDSFVRLWRFKTGDAVKSSAAIAAGRVFVGSNDSKLYALDLATGKLLWSFKAEDCIEAAPCVGGGKVYVGADDGFLYALDAATGTLAWKYQTEGKIMGGANSVPAPDGKATWILVGSYDNRLHCVDAATGKGVWTYSTGNYVNGAPAVADGKATFGGCDAIIHVVAIADGRKLAAIETGSYIAASAAMAGSRVFVGNYGGDFLCADVATGKIVWRRPGADGDPFFASPAIGDDRVVVGSRDKRLHCFARDSGKPLWTFRTRGEVDSSPVICGDKVVFGSADGRLYMVRLADGKQLWSYEVGEPLTASPAVADGIVVIGSEDGTIYAFGRR